MNPEEIVGEHFKWIRETSEIEDARDRSRRPDADYGAMVDVFEDRVRFWFLNIADDLVQRGPSPGDYVALSIGLAFIEGVEQYRRGNRTPRRKSGAWFKHSARTIFPLVDQEAVDELWERARCGLFHHGFTTGKTLVSYGLADAFSLVDGYLQINPRRFIAGIFEDFEMYLRLLRSDASGTAAAKFRALWAEEWEAT